MKIDKEQRIVILCPHVRMGRFASDCLRRWQLVDAAPEIITKAHIIRTCIDRKLIVMGHWLAEDREMKKMLTELEERKLTHFKWLFDINISDEFLTEWYKVYPNN